MCARYVTKFQGTTQKGPKQVVEFIFHVVSFQQHVGLGMQVYLTTWPYHLIAIAVAILTVLFFVW